MLARLILILVIAVTVSACFTEPSSPTLPPTPQPAGPVSVFEDDTFSFEYPAAWHQETFSVPASMARSLVHLSTSVLHDPCTHTAAGVSCGEPVDALDPDGVAIAWVLYEFPAPPGSTPIPNPSAVAVDIGSRPATVTQEVATGSCSDIGGEQELYVRIDVPDAPGNYVEMDACVRGPNQELTGAVIAAMLASVEWKN